MMDGANVWHLFRHVVLPNITPTMVTVWIVTFMYIWDSFLWPLVIMTDPGRQLVQIGIAALFNRSAFASAMSSQGHSSPSALS
ncbi:MAG: ABC transporter permease subunit [Chloroflexi bacterium]|nr:ABC transporter permease subunit [Chloroflexota bacterium]